MQAAAASWPASLTLAACAVSVAILSIEAPLAAALPLVVLPLIYRMNLAILAQAKANTAGRRSGRTASFPHRRFAPGGDAPATIMTNLSILRRASHSDFCKPGDRG